MKYIILLAWFLFPQAVQAESAQAHVEIIVPTTTPVIETKSVSPAVTDVPVFMVNTAIFDAELASRDIAQRPYIDLTVGPRAASVIPKNPLTRSIFDRLTLFIQPRNIEYIHTLMASAEQGQLNALRLLESAQTATDISKARATFELSSSMMTKLERTLQHIDPVDEATWTQLFLDMGVFESRRVLYLYELERELLEHPVQLLEADNFFDAIYQELSAVTTRQKVILNTLSPLTHAERLGVPFEHNIERIALQERSITTFNRARRVLMPEVARGDGPSMRDLFAVYDARYEDKVRFETALKRRTDEQIEYSVIQ